MRMEKVLSFISEKYIMQLLSEYAESEPGKKKILSIRRDIFNGNKRGKGGITRDRAEQILNEISDKFVNTVITVIHSFRGDGVHSVIGEMDINGRVHADITVDEDALHRESLHYMNKNLSIGHGEGVNDILALFTHGYTISGRRPYGFWVRDGVSSENNSSLTRIGALMHRDPNPFLSNFVDKMNNEYSGLCNITLNEKYKGGG